MISITDPKTSLTEQFTPTYAAAINHDMIYDSSYASTVQSRWAAAAKIQYSIVKSLVEAESLSTHSNKAGWALSESLGAIMCTIIGTGSFIVIALTRPRFY